MLLMPGRSRLGRKKKTNRSGKSTDIFFPPMRLLPVDMEGKMGLTDGEIEEFFP